MPISHIVDGESALNVFNKLNATIDVANSLGDSAVKNVGTSAGDVAAGNDGRFSDARTPTTHASSHTNGTDDIQTATASQKGLATAAQITKLDGIEAGADVTDATNVSSAGALMTSALGTGVGTALGVALGSTGSVLVINFAADAGSTDAYVATLNPAPTSLVTGAHYRFMANTANTGTATINFNGLGAKTIVKAAGGITTALADNDIRAGQWVDVVWDGANMQMQSTLGNASVVDLASPTAIGNVAPNTGSFTGITCTGSLLSMLGVGVSPPTFTYGLFPYSGIGLGVSSQTGKVGFTDATGTLYALISSTLSELNALNMGGLLCLKGYTVGTLPSGTQGDTAFVTNALTPVSLATVTGGGAAVVKVFYDGTNWIVQ